jgi:hypothetical protein
MSHQDHHTSATERGILFERLAASLRKWLISNEFLFE